MSVRIEIPVPFRRFADDAAAAIVDAQTVGEALRHLIERYPKLRPVLYAADGRLRRHLNVFVNEKNTRGLDCEATPIGLEDRIILISAVAGG